MIKLIHLKLKVISSFALLFLINCTSNNKQKSFTVIQNNYTNYNVGDLVRDSDYTYKFYLKNIGNVPLVIDTASRSCECTNVIYPKTTTEVDDSAEVIVKYKPLKSDTGIVKTSIVLSVNTKDYFTPIVFYGRIK